MSQPLIITYYWPPDASPGVQRWLKFAKYLSRKGCPPAILTVSNAVAPAQDPTLAEDVPDDVEVYYTKSLEPITAYNLLRGKRGNTIEVGMGEIKNPKGPIKKLAKYLRSNVFIPDAKIGWYFWARRKALKLARQLNTQSLVTTGPPHTTHLIGEYIKTHRPSVKWIVDLRDPWTGLYYEQYLDRSARSQAKNAKLEQRILQNCDQIIVVSEGMKADFEAFADKITVIPNGFDPDDIPAYSPESSEYFELVYTGNLKVNQDITALWKAIKELRSAQHFAKYFRLVLVGNKSQNVLDSIHEYGLVDMLKSKPYVKHSEAVAIMQRANMLYLPIPQSAGNAKIITGKIFEYLASRTPILAIGPREGNAAQILQECGRPQMLEYDDVAGIKEAISKAFEKWRSTGGASPKVEDNGHMAYARGTLTDQLKQLLAA